MSVSLMIFLSESLSLIPFVAVYEVARVTVVTRSRLTDFGHPVSLLVVLSRNVSPAFCIPCGCGLPSTKKGGEDNESENFFHRRLPSVRQPMRDWFAEQEHEADENPNNPYPSGRLAKAIGQLFRAGGVLRDGPSHAFEITFGFF